MGMDNAKLNGTAGQEYTRKDFEIAGKQMHEAVKHWQGTGEIPIAIATDLKKLMINFAFIGNECILQAEKR